MGKIIFSILAVLMSLGFVSFVEAVSISIDTEKDIFFYGDYLNFTVTVDEVSSGFATIFLVDSNGKKSSPIPLAISQGKTVETSPFPFEKTIYPEGRWTLEIEYAGAKAQTEFFLKDSGKVVIPIWIRDVGKMWATNLISAEQYTTAIEYLIEEDIILIPQGQGQQESAKKIPDWMKTTTSWWGEGIISDQEYAKSLEFLIKEGIIVV